MADETATFAVKLEDQVSSGAQRAAQAMQELRDRIKQDTSALAELQRALRQMQGGTTASKDAIIKLREQIAAKKQALSSAQESMLSMRERYGELADEAGRTSASMGDFAAGLQRMGGPLGTLAGKASGLATVLAGGLAVAAGLAAAGVLALAASLVGAIASVARYAVAVGDARRSEMLHLEALTKIPNWYGIAAGKASDLMASIDRVSQSAAISREQISGYAEQLYRMGLRGQNLADALDATSIAASAAGDNYASMVMQQAAGMGMLGQSTKAYADLIRSRLGGIAEKQALSLSVQMQKLRGNVAALFTGIKVENILRAFNVITSAFSQQTAMGRALKAIVEAMFGPLDDFAGGSTPMAIKRFLQGIVIMSLLAAISVLKVRSALQDTFGGTTVLARIDWLNVALVAGAAVAILAAGAIGVLALAMSGLALTTLVAFTPLIALVALVSVAVGSVLLFAAVIGGALVGAFLVGKAAWDAFWQALQGKDWSNIGQGVIDGIIAGLAAGKAKLLSIARDVAGGIKDAFAGVLQISSPSRVFAGYGRNIAAGLSSGIEEGERGVAESAVSLAAAASTPAAKPGSVGSAARTTTVSATFGDIIINGADAKDAESIARAVEQAVTRLLERVATSTGAEVDGLVPAT